MLLVFKLPLLREGAAAAAAAAELLPGRGSCEGRAATPPVGLMRMASRSSATAALAAALALLLPSLASLERIRPLLASSNPSPLPRSPMYSCRVDAGRVGREDAREVKGVAMWLLV